MIRNLQPYKVWLIFKLSFTGLCEIAMGGENIAQRLHFTQYECYPGVEESDGEDDADVMSQSYDLHAGRGTVKIKISFPPKTD